ncbi:MAG: 50S ribosomal protein L32 [Defluviitaleaceae bacterium]|nr:50S ribosomal protein L32 [Defluviitaleaceae bacterium]
MPICPKGKISKARRDKRRAQTWKIPMPGLSTCPNCGEIAQPHKVCRTCGVYKRRDILKLAE